MDNTNRLPNITNIDNIQNKIKSIGFKNIEKYSIIGLSITLYIYALIKMTNHSPSTRACFNKPNQIMNNGDKA